MGYPHVETVTVVTDADGAATEYSIPVSGAIHQVRYVKPGSGSYTDGVDFTITSETTGATIWAEDNVNASKTVCPRQATHSTLGVAALYAGGGSAVLEPVVLVNDRVKIVLASGGDTKTGTFYITVV